MLKWAGVAAGGLAALLAAASLVFSLVINPAVMDEIRNNPDGDDAREAMLLTFGDRTLPVNYLREGDTVYLGADGRWWRAFTGDGIPVTVLIRGETRSGHAVTVLGDDAMRDEVFARLRPTEPAWLPDWMRGKLIVVTLAETAP